METEEILNCLESRWFISLTNRGKQWEIRFIQENGADGFFSDKMLDRLIEKWASYLKYLAAMDARYEAATHVPISDERIEEIVKYATAAE